MHEAWRPTRHEDETRAATGTQGFHAAKRSLAMFVSFVGLMLAFVALMFVPAVASLLTVHRASAVAVAVAWLACTAAATTAYHLTGLSRLYLVLDAIESIGIQAGVCLLVYRSGGALSIFWLAYLWHTQLIAGLGFRVRNLAVIATAPTALVLAFWLKGDSASVLLTLLVGVMGAYFYGVMARLHSSREASRAREALLKRNLARLGVAEERSRIARDLHDSVAGELAALAWRLRQVPLGPQATPLGTCETEVAHIEGRIRGVLTNLRRVVFDLRQEHRGWVDTIAVLRERCHDLCASRQLVFSVSGAPEGSHAERLADDVQCIVSELVRNATTHADPSLVEVRIQIGDGVRLSVSDDGTGLPPDSASRSSGGLANLRARVTRLGGELRIQSANPGTHVEVRLPAVSHDHGMVTVPGSS
jgi:signal transduction histidine kinase